MLLCSEGTFCVSIYCNEAAWTGHLELEISIMWHHVESSKRGSSEQCVVAAAEGAISKISSSLRKLSGEPKTTSSMIEPVQRASMPGINPLKVVIMGLIREGLMPILRTIS